MTIARWTVAACVALLVAGCAVFDRRLEVETYANPGEVVRPASVQGRLEGVVENGLACFWLGQDRATVIRWPEGYTAVEDPLRVLDSDGEEVAQTGDHLSLAGGARGGNSACAGESSEVWWASS